MFDDNAFEGQVVLITGAANGIGAACARAFQERGALLSLVDRSEPGEADLSKPLWTHGDIADRAVQETVVRRTIDAYGRIDVLVNNAGVGIYGRVTETRMDLARRMFDVNVFAAVGLTSLVTPYMRSRASGSVVNISSVSAFVPTPWNTMYCASKSALHSFSRGLRRELASDGIHVLTVVPGIVRTGFRENVLAGEAPTGVLKIRSSVSPDALAAATTEALRKRKSLLFFPFRGLLFCAVDLLLTPIMDLAIRFWHTPAAISTTPVQPDILNEREGNLQVHQSGLIAMTSPAPQLTKRALQSGGISNTGIYGMVMRALERRGLRGGVLVDVGCGAGNLWSRVHQDCDRYIGVDAIQYPGLPEAAEFVQCDLDSSRIPLAGGTADVVVAVEIIEHLENPRAFMRELVRLVKDGGIVIVTTPNQLSLLSLLTLLVRSRFSLFQDCNYPAHLTALLEIDLLRIGNECGLLNLDIEYSRQGRVFFTSRHYPGFLSNAFPRRLSDNLLLIGRKPSF